MHGSINDWEASAEARVKRPAMAVLGVALIIGGFFHINSGDIIDFDAAVALTGAALLGLNADPISHH